MKKFYFPFYAAFLLSLIACTNENPATSTPESSAPVAKTPPATPPPALKKEKVEVQYPDTPRTTISVGKSGGSVKTKKGTEVTVGQGGVNIGTKDVKIDIKRDSN